MIPISPLKKAPSLHVSVQESLRAYIVENRLEAGAPLPPEGELAQQLGVSRNSVREGVKALESLGVLEMRRGVGVFVKAFSFEPLLANLTYGLGDALTQIADVIAVRRGLEVGMIDAALRADRPRRHPRPARDARGDARPRRARRSPSPKRTGSSTACCSAASTMASSRA